MSGKKGWKKKKKKSLTKGCLIICQILELPDAHNQHAPLKENAPTYPRGAACVIDTRIVLPLLGVDFFFIPIAG